MHALIAICVVCHGVSESRRMDKYTQNLDRLAPVTKPAPRKGSSEVARPKEARKGPYLSVVSTTLALPLY